MVRARRSVVDQLIKSRLLSVAFPCVVIGLCLMVLGQWPGLRVLGWWQSVVSEFGLLFTTAGLVPVWIDFANRHYGERQALDRQREALRDDVTVVRDAVLLAPYASVDTLRTYSPQALDTLGANVFRARFPGRAAAVDAYADTRDELEASTEDWRGVSVTVDLTPWAGGPASGPGSMLVATVRWTYTTVPVVPVLRFACVSDQQEYDALLRDPQVTSVWQFGESGSLGAGSREVFEVLSVIVDGHRVNPIQRAPRAGSQTYTAALPADIVGAGREVTISYTYTTLAARLGHHLFLSLPRHTHGFQAHVNFGDAGIWHITPRDFTTGTPPRTDVLPLSAPPAAADVAVDHWVKPGFGVAFIWTLTDEVHPTPHDSPELR